MSTQTQLVLQKPSHPFTVGSLEEMQLWLYTIQKRLLQTGIMEVDSVHTFTERHCYLWKRERGTFFSCDMKTVSPPAQQQDRLDHKVSLCRKHDLPLFVVCMIIIFLYMVLRSQMIGVWRVTCHTLLYLCMYQCMYVFMYLSMSS